MASSSEPDEVEDAELVAGVLDRSPDPVASSRDLAALLTTASTDRAAARRVGLDPDLVDVLRGQFGNDVGRIRTACREGAVWVLGRRSVTVAEPWDLVASLPPGEMLPTGLRYTTAETLTHLVTAARRSLRLAAPFIDRSGLSFLGDALAAATQRGVALEVLLPTRSTHADDALQELRETIRRSGSIARFSVSRLRFDAPWAHLKVLTCDASSAYIGSANVTRAGLTGHNLELGVLVRGPGVAVVERVLDLFRKQPPAY
jgi:phosphatidylserine/phosphatidylglycerophosphate/cardiolipin synthase-like enzyme